MSEVKEQALDQGREGTQWSEVQFGRNRFYNFLGGTQASTISVKELGGDNGIDQICDGKTNMCYIEIGEDLKSVTVVDGGKGISLRQTKRKDNDKMSTFMFLNVAKLYTSTNYQEDEGDSVKSDASSTIGQNGIGSKISNFCSAHFTVGIVAQHPKKHASKRVVSVSPDATYNKTVHDKIYGTEENPANCCVKGYHFQQGNATIDGTPMDESVPEWIQVNVPTFYGKEEPYGYFVHAEYDESVLGDEIKCDWINDYIKARLLGCTMQKEDIFVTYRYPVKSVDADGKESVEMKQIVYAKPVDRKGFEAAHKKEIDSGELEILLSWDDMCESLKAEHPDEIYGPYDYGFYRIYYSKDADLIKDIPNIAQGAKVNNPRQFLKKFAVGNTTISIPIPCVFKLTAKVSRGLTYNDQTKDRLTSNQKTPPKIHINCLEKQFDKLGELKEYFNRLANDKYLKSNQKGGYRSDSYWSANGGMTAREFFSKDVDKKSNLEFILGMIKDDPDVIKYCQEQKIDFADLQKQVAAL